MRQDFSQSHADWWGGGGIVGGADQVGSVPPPAVLLLSISSLLCIVITVVLCTCCCRKKLKKEEEDEGYYTAVVGPGLKDKNKQNGNAAVKENRRPLPGDKDPVTNRPLLSSSATPAGGAVGGVTRALPSLPTVAENGRAAALIHSSKELGKESDLAGNLTRESSTSELYATVDKPSQPANSKQPTANTKHLYAKIGRKTKDNQAVSDENYGKNATYETIGPDPLYSKVKEPSPKVHYRKEKQYAYPTFPGRPLAGKNEGSSDPKYERVEGPYSVVDSEDPYSSIKSEVGVPSGSKDTEKIYAPESSTTSSSDDAPDPRYARIHKERRSFPSMGPVGEEEGPVVPNRLEDELAVDYLYAKVRRRHSDSITDPRGSIRGTGPVTTNAAPPNPEMPGPSGPRLRPPGGDVSTGFATNPPPPLPYINQARMEFFNRQQRGSTGGSTNSGREPSYKYITVRESAETLRARIAQEALDRAALEEERNRTHSDPSLHYYSTIGSENSYEMVPETSAGQQGLYEGVPYNPGLGNRNRHIDESSGFIGSMNQNVTMVEIDTSEFNGPYSMLRPAYNHQNNRFPTEGNDIRPPEPPTSPIPSHAGISSTVRQGYPTSSTPKPILPGLPNAHIVQIGLQKDDGVTSEKIAGSNEEISLGLAENSRTEMVVSTEFSSEKSLSISGHSTSLQRSMTSSLSKEELANENEAERSDSKSPDKVSIGAGSTGAEKSGFRSIFDRSKARSESPSKDRRTGSLEKNLAQSDEARQTTLVNTGAVFRTVSPPPKSITPEFVQKKRNDVREMEKDVCLSEIVAGGSKAGLERRTGSRPGSRPQSPSPTKVAPRSRSGSGSPSKGFRDRDSSVSEILTGKIKEKETQKYVNPASVFQESAAVGGSVPSSPKKAPPGGKSGGIFEQKTAPNSRAGSPKKENRFLAENQRPENLGTLDSASEKKSEKDSGKSAGDFSHESGSKVHKGLSGDGGDHANCFCHSRRPNPEAVIKENISVMEKSGRRSSAEKEAILDKISSRTATQKSIYRL